MIGVIGSHGVGKTTLARQTAEALGYHFCQTSISDVYKRMGKDPAVRMSFDERMDMQIHILNELRSEWNSYLGEKAIADRTPLDLIAYTLADVDSYDALSAEQEERLATYIGMCLGIYAKFFEKVVLVPNHLPVAQDPHKLRANLSWAYRNKLEVLLRGVMNMYGVEFEEIRKTGLEDRVEELKALIV